MDRVARAVEAAADQVWSIASAGQVDVCVYDLHMMAVQVRRGPRARAEDRTGGGAHWLSTAEQLERSSREQRTGRLLDCRAAEAGGRPPAGRGMGRGDGAARRRRGMHDHIYLKVYTKV